MKRFVARYEVKKALENVKLYIKTEDNAMVIPMCRSVNYQRSVHFDVKVVKNYPLK